MLSWKMAVVLASVARAQQTTALGDSPWLCAIPDSDPRTGTIFIKLDYCSYHASVQVTPPSLANPRITHDGKCLDASEGDVIFKDCNDEAPQQWQFHRPAAAKKSAALTLGSGRRRQQPEPDEDHGGFIMFVDHSVKASTNGTVVHQCLQPIDARTPGSRISLTKCSLGNSDQDNNVVAQQVWRPLSPPVQGSTLLVMPETKWCIGISFYPYRNLQPQECVEGRVAQSFVRDRNSIIHPAAGRTIVGYNWKIVITWCLKSPGVGGGLTFTNCDAMDGGTRNDFAVWSLDESSGHLSTRGDARNRDCLKCKSLNDICHMESCEYSGGPPAAFKFAWSTSAPQSLDADDGKVDELLPFEGEDEEIQSGGAGGPAEKLDPARLEDDTTQQAQPKMSMLLDVIV